MTIYRNALDYHSSPTPGKVAVQPTKPCETARDLALAYSPGVAEPCLEIEKDPYSVYKYTSKGNLVAVISNGTAVLGLGDIGPAAGKPVMEGKGVLFKVFADVDVFDLEVDCKDPQKFVEIVAALGPTFGGINLEDIKAPECFYIEQELQKRLDIPVFHDDQHGTAIIAGAALLNAIEVAGKSVESVKVVVSGAGASAIACTKMLLQLGVQKKNVLMVDTTGVIYKGRTKGMNEFKSEFAADTDRRTLSDAMIDADIFLGLSAKDLVSPEMVCSMAANPIVFAMANPDPEITFPAARAARSDVIVATGRSDYPNQVNNVLGFPFIFRGALDVRASRINEEMKLAAVHAIAKLAKEPVPESVRRAYGNAHFSFGADYLIPKPFDPRVLYYVAPAVAQAAMETGVAREKVDLEQYALQLKGKRNQARELISVFYSTAKRSPSKRIAFPEGSEEKVVRAALMARDEGIAQPVLLGERSRIEETANRLALSLEGVEIIEPFLHSDYRRYVESFFQANSRRGVTLTDAEREVRRSHQFANMMLANGDVDGLICGVDRRLAPLIKPILDTVGLRDGVKAASALYILAIKKRLFFFADTAINLSMTSEKLAEIAVMAAEFARSMQIEPRVAMLSFSNFGGSTHPQATMVRDAVSIARSKMPSLIIDGEMQADAAVMTDILREDYPFSTLKEAANVLIFPDMQSGNISYKLLQRLGDAKVIGPIILGLRAPAYVLQRHATVDEIFNMITVAVAQADTRKLALAQKVSVEHSVDGHNEQLQGEQRSGGLKRKGNSHSSKVANI